MHTFISKSTRRDTAAETSSQTNWSLSRRVAVNVLSILTLLAIYVLTVSVVRLATAGLFTVLGWR